MGGMEAYGSQQGSTDPTEAALRELQHTGRMRRIRTPQDSQTRHHVRKWAVGHRYSSSSLDFEIEKSQGAFQDMSKVGSLVLNICFAMLFLCFPNFLSIHPPTHPPIHHLSNHPSHFKILKKILSAQDQGSIKVKGKK